MSSKVYDYFHDFAKIFNSMKLEDSSVVRFKLAKEFTEKQRINAIDFAHDGKSLITSSDDDTIRVYDCEKGIIKRELFSKKYGVDQIKYTHAMNTAIHASTKENDIIRYLSLHDNKYIRYFVGHDKRVVTIGMSPADDTFVSGSLDETLRIWDLRSDKGVAKLPIDGSPIVSYDPEGLIFVVGLNSESLRFYDVRNYTTGPFNTVKFKNETPNGMLWKSLKFSPDGKQMLITTNQEQLIILDAFSGSFTNRLLFGSTSSTIPIEHVSEASYSPDSQYIISGAEDGCLHIWSSLKGSKVCVLKSERPRPEPVQCVKFNPKFMLIASACSKMSFWIPDEQNIV